MTIAKNLKFYFRIRTEQLESVTLILYDNKEKREKLNELIMIFHFLVDESDDARRIKMIVISILNSFNSNIYK